MPAAISIKQEIDYGMLWDKVYEGLDFMMEHFEDCEELPRQRTRFPRNLLTGPTRRPYTVNSREEAMMYYKPALYEDCYLNAYTNYEEMIQKGELPPTYKPLPRHVMIDLDRVSFQTDEELETALKETLANIRENITGLSGREPTVIWSGNGYHVHIPLDGWESPLEELPEFYNFRNYPAAALTDKFLRWIERELTNGKADQHHNPSIKSCLFRVPGTINSKAKAAGKDPFVRIVQGKYPYLKLGLPQHYNRLSRPTNTFLNKFLASLIQEVIDAKVEKLNRRRYLTRIGNNNNSNNSMSWVDRLLQTPVEDGRKNLIFWVLAPYLITVRGLDYDRAYHILEAWLEKCDSVRSLEPDWTSFRYRMRYCLDTAEDQERKPIRFDTFKEYYPGVYGELFREGGV